MAETPPRRHHRKLREDDLLNPYACGRGTVQGFLSGHKYSSSILYRAAAPFFQTLLLQESKKWLVRSGRVVSARSRHAALPGSRVVGTTLTPPGWPDAEGEMLQYPLHTALKSLR